MKLCYLLVLILLFLFISSCNIFQTRSPEEPDSGNLNYPLATSPLILIENFQLAFKNKNLSAYQSCFFTNSERKYLFIPSSDAFSLYKEVFDNWDINSELTFAKNLFSKFPSEDSPTLLFTNQEFNSFGPDSSTFFANYEVGIFSKDNAINNTYKGVLQIVLFLDKSGIWKIGRWNDFNSKLDDFPTISHLKAKLVN
ncbi:MAG: hypothetical protein N2517_02295 [Ignavibacteria bacterium]|nr:hypothetical protein [Ignavibacteria bacterium]